VEPVNERVVSLTHLGWLEAPGALFFRLTHLGLPACLYSQSCLLWLLPGLVQLHARLVLAMQE